DPRLLTRRIEPVDALVAATRQQCVGPAVAGHHGAGIDLHQRLEHETALVHPRMWKFEARTLALDVVVHQQVEIDPARAETRAVATSPLPALQRLQRIKQLNGIQRGVDPHHGVDEIGLVIVVPRRGAIQRRARLERYALGVPECVDGRPYRLDGIPDVAADADPGAGHWAGFLLRGLRRRFLLPPPPRAAIISTTAGSLASWIRVHQAVSSESRSPTLSRRSMKS